MDDVEKFRAAADYIREHIKFHMRERGHFLTEQCFEDFFEFHATICIGMFKEKAFEFIPKTEDFREYKEIIEKDIE